MDPKINEQMKNVTAVLAAVILDAGGELTVSEERLVEVKALMAEKFWIAFQFSNDGRTVKLSRREN
jgi:hypothetical protein